MKHDNTTLTEATFAFLKTHTHRHTHRERERERGGERGSCLFQKDRISGQSISGQAHWQSSSAGCCSRALPISQMLPDTTQQRPEALNH